MKEPAAIVVPAISVERRANRLTSCTGGSYLSASSTACPMSDGGREGSKLGWVPQQREHGRADEAPRRLVPGDEQQHAQPDQLVLGQRAAGVVHADERRDQVAARGAPP